MALYVSASAGACTTPARPVDRIDDQHQRLAEPGRRVGDLFRHPGGVGHDLAQALFQKMIDEKVGLCDRRAAVLVLDIRVRALAMAEIAKRDLARLARGFGQRLEERVGIDFNLQDHCAPVPVET